MTQSSSMRRLPKQKRGEERVEKILDAAALVFDEVGYEAATTHSIAARANTAVGSLYQFFPDKAAIFHALELRHIQRVRAMWSRINTLEIFKLPLQQMISKLVAAVTQLFAHPTSRVVFVQFFSAPEIFQAIDESFTKEAIDFTANLLKQRNCALSDKQCSLLAEVSVHCTNTLILIALRSSDRHSQQLVQQIENLLVSYLAPHVGDECLHDNVMNVRKCPRCQSDRLCKNGHRHGKQRYLCKDCGKQFPEMYALRGYPDRVKQQCLDLHDRGMSFREIERQTRVSHNTVIQWVKEKNNRSRQ